MTTRLAQTEAPIVDSLAQRCQTMGITLLTLDASGTPTAPSSANAASIVGGLVRKLSTWPLFLSALKQQVAQWSAETEPSPAAVWPGCWLLPVPTHQRRRLIGYQVGILLSAEFADGEQLHALCDAAELDHRVMQSRLRVAPAVGAVEVKRYASLLRWMADDMANITRQNAEIAKLSQQLGECYEELSLVYKLSAHMTVSQDPRTFLEEVCAELQQVVGLSWLSLQIIDNEERLHALQSQTVVAGEPPVDLPVLADIGRQLIKSMGAGDPRIVDDVQKLGIEALTPLTRGALIVPIVLQQRPVGVLYCADKLGSTSFSSVDSKLVTATAQNMSIFLENAMLYEDMQDMFMGMLHSLIASIDAKDSYTCGHSERVAWLSRQLAAAAGFDEATVERVYLSALVHDVGKIGVPEAVLTKPGKLDDQEFEMIKAHPEIGVRILKDIRQMQDLLPGVLHHHERYDGRGYPHKLAGENIPIFGRLIALADSFDAMSSNRTYRRALSPEHVLNEIKNCAGKQFDPKLVEFFVKLDFEPFYRMVTEHQQRQSPLDRLMRNSA